MTDTAERLYTTRHYPCGCSAEGPGDVPAYCGTHGVAPMPCDAWDSRCIQYKLQRDELANALRIAKDTIRAWHGEEVWHIYDRASPEMKTINAALAKAQP